MSRLLIVGALACAGVSLFVSGCEKSAKAQQRRDAEGTGPTHAEIVPDTNAGSFRVEHPEQFRLTAVQEYVAMPELNVTGAVSPDVSRQVPVISLASGRVVEMDTQLGDAVTKGQLLFKVRSTDVAGAFSDYRKAVVDEQLTKVQLDRAKVLYEHGAIAKSALETAQNAEDNSRVDVDTALAHLRLLGSDPDHPESIVSVYAPVSGVITDQQITNSSGVQALSSPNPLTISNMSQIWILCDVYENDLPQVRIGELADIHVTAYPDNVLKARVGNIGPVLDPNLRTAKVRLQVGNPGFLRLGMFVTATFHGPHHEVFASVPASAILHLHDREWVYTPQGHGAFQRLEVVSGNMLPGHMQEVVSGLKPGMQVVADALDLQHTVSQ